MNNQNRYGRDSDNFNTLIKSKEKMTRYGGAKWSDELDEATRFNFDVFKEYEEEVDNDTFRRFNQNRGYELSGEKSKEKNELPKDKDKKLSQYE